jgi:asparagine synthase (glutamine-hydrolysing)
MHAGIYSRNPRAVDDFLAIVQDETNSVGAAKGRVVRCPESGSQARLALAFWNTTNLPLAFAQKQDGSFALVDGELYNQEELGANSRGELAKATDDASTVLALYSSLGKSCFRRFDSAATITIWDAARETLLIARDRWGQAPQFYCKKNDRLLWASELRTLLLLGVDGEIDADALDFFIAAGYFPAPWSPVSSTRKLPAGFLLSPTQAGTVEVERFWTPSGRPKLNLTMEETVERQQRLIERSVRKRYQPSTKTGVLLSGGVDSSLLVGILTKVVGANIETFTFHYSGYEGAFNENPLASRIAQHFNTNHHVIGVTPTDLADSLEKMVLGYEEPFTYGVHSYFLHDVAENGVRSLISGRGVGEFYPSPRDLAARKLRRLPLPFRHLARWITPSYGSHGKSWDRRVSDLFLGAATGLPGSANQAVTSDTVRPAVYSDPKRAAGRHRVREKLCAVVEEFAEESDRDQLSLLVQRLFIAEASGYWNMRWGRVWNIRGRHPYFDNDLQEFALRLRRPERNKPEFRNVAAKLMPASMAYAPKVSQTIPIREWFRGPLVDLLRTRLSSHELKKNGIFSPAGVHHLIEEHIERRGNHEWALWAILTTTVWQDVVLRGSSRPAR